MKLLITAIVSVLLSVPAFAACTVSFQEPGNWGMGNGFTGKKSYQKMIRILEAKGYEVKSDPASRKTADYVLDVDTFWGYDCGTGLTWVDYLVVPAGYVVNLSLNHGNQIFYREKDLTFPGIGIMSIARAKLYRTLKSIPKCE